VLVGRRGSRSVVSRKTIETGGPVMRASLALTGVNEVALREHLTAKVCRVHGLATHGFVHQAQLSKRKDGPEKAVRHG
jgi:hypothetical protein